MKQNNLRTIMDDIQSALRHGVNVKAERDDLIRRINRVLRRVAAKRQWSWRRRLSHLRLKASVTVTTWTPATSDFAIDFALPSGWSAVKDVQSLVGAQVTFDATRTDYDYVIEHASESGGTVTIYLDPRFVGVTGMSGNEVITISFLRYALPGDLAEVFNVELREDDSGPLHEITLDQEAWLMLNEDDDAGIPGAFVLSPNRPVGDYPDPSLEYDHTFAEPPRTAPTLTSTAAGGSFAGGEVFEYGYCWVYGGLISPMSPTAQVTVGGASYKVEVSDLEVWGAAAGTEYGRQKYLFRRQVYADRYGPWYKIATVVSYVSGAGGSLVDLGTFSPNTPVGRNQTIDRFPVGDVRRFIRFYPVTDADRVVELHYLAHIPELVADEDEPAIPAFAQDILLHEVVVEMTSQTDAPDVYRHHRAMAKELWTDLARRELGSAATMHRKRSIFEGRRRGLRFGTATWNG